MKLKTVRLCIECEEIFDPHKIHRLYGEDIAICPSCGNKVTILLSKFVETVAEHKKRKGGVKDR